MHIFEFRDHIIHDYASYIKSFIQIRDTRISEYVGQNLNAGILWPDVKPKITRPVPMLGILMQLPPEIDGCIALQMHMVSAHPALRGVVRDCTPLASG